MTFFKVLNPSIQQARPWLKLAGPGWRGQGWDHISNYSYGRNAVCEHFPEMHPVVLSAYRMALDVKISILKKVSAPAGVTVTRRWTSSTALSLWKSSASGPLWHATLPWMLSRRCSLKTMAKRILTSRSRQGWESYLGTSPKTCVPYGSQGCDHPQMYDYIKSPQIVLLDFSLKYGKGAS